MTSKAAKVRSKCWQAVRGYSRKQHNESDIGTSLWHQRRAVLKRCIRLSKGRPKVLIRLLWKTAIVPNPVRTPGSEARNRVISKLERLIYAVRVAQLVAQG